MDQTWKNCKKPNFGSDFGLFGSKLDPQFFFILIFFAGFSSTSS